MVTQNNEYDIAIIGGGISGLGLARRAAHWGFKTALFERGEFGAETSANSLRIIHGGFRYLQTLNLPRVFESIRAQKGCVEEFPEFIKPLPCAMPLKRFGLRSAIPVAAALVIYEHLKKRLGHNSLVEGRVIAGRDVENLFPEIASLASNGVLAWTDALISDYAGFVSALKQHATMSGAELHEKSPVKSLNQNGKQVSITFDSSSKQVSARVVFNAAGPDFAKLSTEIQHASIKWTRAFNIKLKRHLVNRAAFGLPSDSRLLFFTPRESGTVVGTWYLEGSSSTQQLRISDSEYQAAIDEMNRSWPGINITCSDVIGLEIGLLPMKRIGTHGPVLYGREQIFCSDRIFHIMSTKLTTFDEQANRALVLARKLLA